MGTDQLVVRQSQHQQRRRARDDLSAWRALQDPPVHEGLRPVLRALVVGHDALFRQRLVSRLADEDGIYVLAQTGSFDEAISLLTLTDIAVVVDRGDGQSVTLIREIRRVNPTAIVLALVDTAEHSAVFAGVMAAGAQGVLPATAQPEEVAAALRWLREGNTLLSPGDIVEVMRLVGRQREGDREAQRLLQTLTPREWEIMQGLAQGCDDRSISIQFGISRNTVRAHIVNILQKLGVDSRLQALVFAVRHGAVKIR